MPITNLGFVEIDTHIGTIEALLDLMREKGYNCMNFRIDRKTLSGHPQKIDGIDSCLFWSLYNEGHIEHKSDYEYMYAIPSKQVSVITKRLFLEGSPEHDYLSLTVQRCYTVDNSKYHEKLETLMDIVEWAKETLITPFNHILTFELKDDGFASRPIGPRHYMPFNPQIFEKLWHYSLNEKQPSDIYRTQFCRDIRLPRLTLNVRGSVSSFNSNCHVLISGYADEILIPTYKQYTRVMDIRVPT